MTRGGAHTRARFRPRKEAERQSRKAKAGKKLVNRETVLRIWVSGPLLKLWRILKARPLRWDNDAQRQIHVKVGATNRFNSSVCTHHCGGTGLPRLCFSTILENCEAETGRGNKREEERDLELRKKKSPLVGIFALCNLGGGEYDELYRCDLFDSCTFYYVRVLKIL